MAFHEWFDVECWNKPDFMTCGLSDATPVMSGPASFHGDNARRKILEHFLKLRSCQFLPEININFIMRLYT